jgi:hypothetical protein
MLRDWFTQWWVQNTRYSYMAVDHLIESLLYYDVLPAVTILEQAHFNHMHVRQRFIRVPRLEFLSPR